MRTGFFGLVLTAIALGVSPGLAQNSEEVKVVFEHAIPNIEGKRMVAQIVSYPPGGKSLPHRHAPSAFIYARVLSGAIRSQVGDEPRPKEPQRPARATLDPASVFRRLGRPAR
jgi:quercetin dioxygenase-like cupin family protein